MKPGALQQLHDPSDHLLFEDEEAYREEYQHLKTERCVFRNVRLKEAVFDGGSMKHNQFIDAYLNGVAFRGLDLTGTRFEGCDLRHATFDRCKLWYVEFHRCHLHFDSIKDSLPSKQKEVNLRRQLLRSLRVNATEMGDTAGANRLLILELAAEREEKYCVFKPATDYFAENFDRGQRIRAFGAWFVLKSHSVLWGYGVQLKRLLLTSVLMVILFAFLFFLIFDAGFQSNSANNDTLSFGQSLYVSAVTFSALGSSDFDPVTTGARVCTLIESLAGCVFLGLFAAAVYRWIRR